MKLEKVDPPHQFSPDYTFYCQGCHSDHGIWITKRNRKGAIWIFDGNLDKPTISPSINCGCDDHQVNYRCHFFIKAGMIEFLSDCTHSLAGQTVEMEEIII